MGDKMIVQSALGSFTMGNMVKTRSLWIMCMAIHFTVYPFPASQNFVMNICLQYIVASNV